MLLVYFSRASLHMSEFMQFGLIKHEYFLLENSYHYNYTGAISLHVHS